MIKLLVYEAENGKSIRATVTKEKPSDHQVEQLGLRNAIEGQGNAMVKEIRRQPDGTYLVENWHGVIFRIFKPLYTVEVLKQPDLSTDEEAKEILS